MLDSLLSLIRKIKCSWSSALYSVYITNRFPADRSKTRLNTRFQIEVNLSSDLNQNFVLRLSLGLKLKYYSRSNPKVSDTLSTFIPGYSCDKLHAAIGCQL